MTDSADVCQPPEHLIMQSVTLCDMVDWALKISYLSALNHSSKVLLWLWTVYGCNADHCCMLQQALVGKMQGDLDDIESESSEEEEMEEQAPAASSKSG